MTPGSSAAKSFGCICPETENNFGLIGASGYLGGEGKWIIVGSCSVHGASTWRIPSEQKSSGWEERPESYGYIKLNNGPPGHFGSIEVIEIETEESK